MKRDEDGFNAGYRRIGTLALWSIPAVLGIGASIWLGFVMASHDWLNTLSQEQRRAIYVGAAHRPKGKLKIETPNEGCVHIDRVDLDGSTAALYFHSNCTGELRAPGFQWQLISPDGTLLSSEWWYASMLGGPQSLNHGDKGEVVFEGWMHGIKTDDRAATVRFTVR